MRSVTAGFSVLKMRGNRRLFCTNEEWRVIPGFSMYHASSDGNIKNIKTNKIRFINYERWHANKTRPKSTFTNDDGARKNMYVDRLVALAFHYRTDHAQMSVNHKDGNPLNNKSENLEFMETATDQMKHASGAGLLNGNKIAVNLTDIVSGTQYSFDSHKDCRCFFKQKGIHITQYYIYIYYTTFIH